MPRFGWPRVDTVHAYGTLLIAAFIVWKSLSMLEGFVARDEVGGDAALGIIGGLVLAVSAFLFQREAAKQSQAAFEKGLNTPGPNATTITADTATVQGGDPTIVNGKVK